MLGTYDWLMLVGGICFLIVPWPMLIIAYFYVNNPKYKNRLVELGYGLNNDWIKGKRIDFVDSTMLFAGMSLVAKVIKLARMFRGNKQPDHILYPNLNRDQNYLKLWQEFRFYSLWTISTFYICMFGIFCLYLSEWV